MRQRTLGELVPTGKEHTDTVTLLLRSVPPTGTGKQLDGKKCALALESSNEERTDAPKASVAIRRRHSTAVWITAI